MPTENSLIRSSKKSSAKIEPQIEAKFAAELARAGCPIESWRLLSQEFYERNTLQVARDLLGKILLVRSGGKVTAGRIVECEAYRENDPACHAWRGETPRNSIMFGEAGRVYVYFIYGMYEMLNIVTEPKGKPAAVLIRALEPLFGLETMQARRPHVQTERDLANGPGRLAHALGVKLSDKGENIMGPRYFVFDDGERPESICVSPRVGITDGKEHLWRFYVSENRFVSKAPQNKLAHVLRNRPGGKLD